MLWVSPYLAGHLRQELVGVMALLAVHQHGLAMALCAIEHQQHNTRQTQGQQHLKQGEGLCWASAKTYAHDASANLTRPLDDNTMDKPEATPLAHSTSVPA